ncbi:MAG: DUF2442 domain-containing protein [Bacteroidales bacterium]|nr:DUF2442 domain-containing protein [Bacteroidales bacterium]
MKTKSEIKSRYQYMIVKADYLHDHLIEITFRDGTVRVVDLENFFTTSKFGLIRKFAPLDQFKQFRIEDGALAWGDNECDINPYSIYVGEFDAKLEYA